MYEGRRPFLDRIFNVGAAQFLCRVNSLEGFGVLGGIAGRRQDRTRLEELIDALDPNVVVDINFLLLRARELAEKSLFEIRDHRVAGRYAGGCGRTRAQEPTELVRSQAKPGSELRSRDSFGDQCRHYSLRNMSDS